MVFRDFSKVGIALSFLSQFFLPSAAFAQEHTSSCPTGQYWHQAMGHCMPCPEKADLADPYQNVCLSHNPNELSFDVHGNQFLGAFHTNGLRGRTAVSGPGMFMIEARKPLSQKLLLRLNFMGTVDRWLIPNQGTPQSLQQGESQNDGTPYLDAQHPHPSPIMGLTFGSEYSLNQTGDRVIRVFYAPRGEPTVGPPAFMHRASREGNPNAPLSHHLQDARHVTSNILGGELRFDKTRLSTSIFSGVEPKPQAVNLDLHPFDSWGVRVERDFGSHLKWGVSYADVQSTEVHESETHQENERALSSWVETVHELGRGTLQTSLIFGQVFHVSENQRLNSLISEFTYQLYKNNFYGSVEWFQRTPDQLGIRLTDAETGARQILSVQLGYERLIWSKGSVKLRSGTSLTQSWIPKDFKSAYGVSPRQIIVYFRTSFKKGSSSHDSSSHHH